MKAKFEQLPPLIRLQTWKCSQKRISSTWADTYLNKFSHQPASALNGSEFFHSHRLKQTPSLLLPSVLQAVAPSSCGSFCWSCWPTSLASPSSAGLVTAGSLSFLTQMRWEVVTLLVAGIQDGGSKVVGQMNKMSSLFRKKQLPFVFDFIIVLLFIWFCIFLSRCGLISDLTTL